MLTQLDIGLFPFRDRFAGELYYSGDWSYQELDNYPNCQNSGGYIGLDIVICLHSMLFVTQFLIRDLQLNHVNK